VFYVLARLSERFGSVLKMPPIYKRFYVAQGFAGLAFLANLVLVGLNLSSTHVFLGMDVALFALIFYHLPLSVAVTISLATTWKYWGWLLVEREK
jgi:hypothetical protein